MTSLARHIPVIETERLRLRAHRRGDFDALAAMWASPRSRYMGGPRDRRAAWDAFTNDCAGWVIDGHGCWAIEARDGGALLGQVGVSRPDHFPEPELGWTLLETAEGQGYATEAARAALGFVRDSLGWASVVSYVAPGNSGSARVAARLGALPDPGAPLPDGETPGDTIVYRHRFTQ